MVYAVKREKYLTCICGRVCKGRAGLAQHGRACPVEVARSAAFIRAIETGQEPLTDADFLAQYSDITKDDQ
ncbi:hypothetical protein PROPHIGD42-2_63 [Mycobacterium phage prophiGD42-2]|nr:hypothetical protein [Mycobacteroides abscessus]MBN7354149.1 hypothetical protein [Mycobacteroides abscessus subsp. abscessus]QST89116.1 hypothetical protein PROPHIGD11-2_63 [Mycobacterium phage prophiGD11-2]QST89935.1 hypothetical protein PROPHIGD08-2_63 [Mycobacterium phage prophiGD08-2]QST90455.1 hypothetical protein PROPHIGD42-2_63 [Mycobacterium phage prophiGD42-2]